MKNLISYTVFYIKYFSKNKAIKDCFNRCVEHITVKKENNSFIYFRSPVSLHLKSHYVAILHFPQGYFPIRNIVYIFSFMHKIIN